MRCFRLVPRGVLLVLALVAALLLVGDVVPRTTLYLTRTLPNDASFRTATAPEEAELLSCTAEGCTPTTRPVVLERETTTSPGTDPELGNKAISADVTTTLRTADDGAELATLTNSSLLTRRSGYPTADSQTRTTIDVPSVKLSGATEPTTREGLEAFFPHTVERRSYQFFDPVLQMSVPLDYVTTVDKDTAMPAYEFQQRLSLGPLSRGFDAPTTGVSGAAGSFYSEEELRVLGYPASRQVTLHPYYSVSRTLTVEPRSGTVLDRDERILVILAGDRSQALELQGMETPARTALRYHAHFDDATLAAQRDVANTTVHREKAFAVLSWFCRLLIVLVVGVALWRLHHRK